jgi:biopolymer transport protein ExbD
MKVYKKKKRSHREVELNMAAMLDMAFQLLAFFILTFKPSPVEGPLSLRMPPKGFTMAPTSGSVENIEEPTEQVPVAVYATPDGEIDRLELGSRVVRGQASIEQTLGQLNQVLGELVSTGATIDGVTLQVAPRLSYERLMQIVEVCTRQKTAKGEPLTKVSFVELSGGGAKP